MYDPQEATFSQIWLHVKYRSEHSSSVFCGYLLNRSGDVLSTGRKEGLDKFGYTLNMKVNILLDLWLKPTGIDVQKCDDFS